MTLEGGLNAWLTEKTGVDCYWLNRPANKDIAVVYRCISPGIVEGNLRATGISEDYFSISIYHTDPEVCKNLADLIKKELHHFSGDLGGYPVQFIEFSGGFDQPLNNEGAISYQFNRDFNIYY